MVLERQLQPLRPAELSDPEPGPGQLLISVSACGVCRTDLHIVDGDLTEPKLPLVPGHQIVGTVVGAGERGERYATGERFCFPLPANMSDEQAPARGSSAPAST
jgi:propanol-preferring alcohol dehydrogenase